MIFNNSKRKTVAFGMLAIWCTEIFLPSAALALTSGPVQPESSSFQPAGMSEMVDLFTGDFKYNIPLLDVDGYPINLNYSSGSGMDDEASWTGLGWNLNAGAINRQVRGVPDDMAGDEVKTEHYTKPKVTVGGRLTGKIEVKGKGKSRDKAKASGSFMLGIFSDNYTGIGAEVDLNAGLSFALANSGSLTAGMGIGASLLSSTSTGASADASPYVSLSLKENADSKTTTSASLSSSFGYNTRSGLKGLTLGGSFGAKHNSVLGRALSGLSSYSTSASVMSYNTEPIFPRIQIPYKSTYGSFSIDAGPVAAIVFTGGGGTGYKSVRRVANGGKFTNPAFGFLYAERGKDQKAAVMDFTREKENPIIPELPNLALPVYTPDMFSYTSQGGSGQFRLYRGGTGAFFDNAVSDESETNTLGLDLGLGTYFHGGVTHFNQSTTNTTHKWTGENNYLKKADFQDNSFNPAREHVYFRQIGEKNAEDKQASKLLYGERSLSVDIQGKTANATFRAKTGNIPNTLPVDSILRRQRQAKRTVISYLNASEASKSALDKKIVSYGFNVAGSFIPSSAFQARELTDRINSFKKDGHISEITVTDGGGNRTVYGIPVYNLKQDEYSFAVGRAGSDYTVTNNNQVGFSEIAGNKPNHFKGIDHYYHKESQPAYASSYLLTAILSPDYQDKTGDGISDDDAGTAIKFNYSKLPYLYKWRTPYDYRKASLNKGLLADPDDDKASIIYGEKEIWYTHSIETKTKIAYFITDDRNDGLGVLGWNGGQDASQKQKRLTEIRLYSKSDLSRPIKVVKFEYTYELCSGVPNSTAGGKLTLKKVYFQYGNTDKGKYHPYIFTYKTNLSESSDPVTYGYMQTDRWGVYKPDAQNPSGFTNEEYPYSNQNRVQADQNAALWNLEKIGLPTGGIIRIDYESDDYAYVQDKRAMKMLKIESLITADLQDVSNLHDASGLRISLTETAPQGVQTNWFKKRYLEGSDYLYAKIKVKLSTKLAKSYGCDFEFIPVYCKVTNVTIDGAEAKILFEKISVSGLSVNPVILAAWQRLKNEYPRYAYPGFENRIKDGDAGKAVRAAVSAIMNAVGNLKELKRNFYERASANHYATIVDIGKSFVRINKTDGFKLGGGARVKKIRMSDDWTAMSENNTNVDASYGQAYEYTTIDQGKVISSGVAAYEPYIGGDENPLKQPVPYIQNIKGGINNFFSLEEPFGESYFPAPGVGYGKVTVRNLNHTGEPDPADETGYTTSEFYTAREFPVFVEVMPIIKKDQKPKNRFSFTGATLIHELILSQGYKIQLNDMHGKPKAERVFNQSGAEITSTVYHYNDNKGAGQKRLKNVATLIHADGTIEENSILGREVEFFTDVREQETKNRGESINVGLDAIPGFLLPIPIPHWPKYDNSEYRLFRSVCAVKVVQYYGIVDKVIKTQNGSSVTTENVAYDALTGEALVTKTQNEFNQDIYSVNLPAYWVYDGMGAAYKTQGLLLKDIATGNTGEITGSYASYLKAGDEIADVSSGDHYWITGAATVKKLIDREGNIQASKNIAFAKVMRSGMRNLLLSNTMNLVCLQKPISNGRLMLTSNSDLSLFRVINASAALFDENWATETAAAGSGTGNTRYLVENTSQSFTFKKGYSIYSLGAYLDFVNANNAGTLTMSDYWGNGSASGGSGPFVRSNIWPSVQGSVSGNEGESLSIDTCITVPQDRYYYVGAGSSGQFSYSFDNSQNGNSFAAFENRWIVRKHFLKAGKHRLTITVHVNYNSPTNDYAGLEIYNNSLEELKTADNAGSGINVIFSTAGIRNKPDIKSFRSRYLAGSQISASYHYTESNGTAPDPCYNYLPAPVKRNVNPYVSGYLGNWRLAQTKVFQEKRSYGSLFNPATKGVGVKDAGYLSRFYSFWHNASAASVWQPNANGNMWITANTVTLYDESGKELENKDALGRYSAALFDFKGQLPAAVASNARFREIYVNSFEDNKAVSPSELFLREFTRAETNEPIDVFAVNRESHSGNYSVRLPSQGLILSTVTHKTDHHTQPYLQQVISGGYMTKDVRGLYPLGFEPCPGKKYVFNAWVKDGNPADTVTRIVIKVNNTAIPLKCKAIIEGWKLIEGGFATGGETGELSVAISPASSSVYIDDIRIHPYDSHLKSYSYDEKNFRLMAELDENGFSTFYEYDDEGTLTRVKKETEKGIVTIKETRSSYKKRTL